MLKLQTAQGVIQISDAVLADITGAAATSCYGVKGMAYRSVTDGLVHMLRRAAMSKGVQIKSHDEGDVSIGLHIVVEPGVNMTAISREIISQVRYLVSKDTGAAVRTVNVFVDSITL